MQTRKEIKKLRPPVTRKSQYGLEYRMNPGLSKIKLIKRKVNTAGSVPGKDKAGETASAVDITKLKKW